MGGGAMVSSDSGGRPDGNSCDYGNETSSSIK